MRLHEPTTQYNIGASQHKPYKMTHASWQQSMQNQQCRALKCACKIPGHNYNQPHMHFVTDEDLWWVWIYYSSNPSGHGWSILWKSDTRMPGIYLCGTSSKIDTLCYSHRSNGLGQSKHEWDMRPCPTGRRLLLNSTSLYHSPSKFWCAWTNRPYTWDKTAVVSVQRCTDSRGHILARHSVTLWQLKASQNIYELQLYAIRQV